ncbi:MAG TPA: outer membrane beta-barrel protein [Verrucomicrobiae bacterium]|jgi:hypothetical protein
MKRKNCAIALIPSNKFLPPLFGLLALGRAAQAQQSPGQLAQPQMLPVESTSQETMTNQFQVFAVPKPAPTPMPYEPFRIGQIIFRPHADYQFMEAHGLLARPGDIENSTIQQFSPGLLVDLGNHWAVDDTMTFAEYSNKHFGNEYDNAFTLTGQTVYLDWVLGFTQVADETSTPLTETAAQTDVQTYSTSVTGHHEVSEHVSEDLSVEQDIYFVNGGFQNSRDWTTLDWLNYDFSPRLSIGAGGGLGYVNVDFGPDQTFEEIMGRLDWRITDKVSMQLNGGAEEWEFLDSSSGGNLFDPVYSGSLQYQPFSSTSLYAGASRAIEESFFRGEVTDSTILSAGLSQRLLQQFYLGVNVGYEESQFITEGETLSNNRTDKFYYIGVRLSHSFLQRGTASIFYEYSDQRSTAPGLTYKSNQEGIEVSYNF